MGGVTVPDSQSREGNLLASALTRARWPRTEDWLGLFELIVGLCVPLALPLTAQKKSTEGKRSPAGRGNRRVQGHVAARLAAALARSLPAMPTWLGIQQKLTFNNPSAEQKQKWQPRVKMAACQTPRPSRRQRHQRTTQLELQQLQYRPPTSETPATPAANKPIASLRLPPFSTEETELSLSQVKCAFGVAGVQDDFSRYQVLVVNLPTEVAIQMRDIINSPNPTYVTLTSALKERLAQSRASRLEALLRHQQLGDQRPSDLRRIQGELSMAGVAPADNGLLRTLYKQRLPQSARAALSLLSDDTPWPNWPGLRTVSWRPMLQQGCYLHNQVTVCAVQQSWQESAVLARKHSWQRDLVDCWKQAKGTEIDKS